MSPVELLDELAAVGVAVRLTGDRLALSGQVPAELLAHAKHHKPALLELLRARCAREGSACRQCGAAPGPQEIGGADRQGWRCDRCLEEAGLAIAGHLR